MDWQGEDFETFLRQFRPHNPRPLSLGRRRSAMPLAVAAILVLGVAIFTRVSWRPADPNGPQPVTAPTKQTPTPSNVQGGQDRLGQRQEMKAPADARQNTPVATSPGTSRRDEAFQRLGATARQGGPLRVGGAIRPPTKFFNVDPIYPDEARAAEVQGLVVLQITIGEDGSVIDAHVVRSIPLLDQAALDAVNQWLFEPTLLNGEPVEIEMNVVVNFTLPL